MSDTTEFSDIYDVFLEKITDDMYLELTEKETKQLLKPMLISALQYFEFPRFNKYDYDADDEEFHCGLTDEEKNIIAQYMVVEWIGQQLKNIDIVRQHVTGSDFKLTSQAQHMSKLKDLQDKATSTGFHLQREYKRHRVDENGNVVSTFGDIMKASTGGYSKLGRGRRKW